LDPRLTARLLDPVVEDFFIVMAICNTVVVSTPLSTQSGGGKQNGNVTGAGGMDRSGLLDLKYEAESPDEAALVQVLCKPYKLQSYEVDMSGHPEIILEDSQALGWGVRHFIPKEMVPFHFQLGRLREAPSTQRGSIGANVLYCNSPMANHKSVSSPQFSWLHSTDIGQALSAKLSLNWQCCLVHHVES
jgi:hypothetical protein